MAYQEGSDGDFIELAVAAQSVAQLSAVLFSAARHYGFPYIWCGAHADPFNLPPGGVLFQNYPEVWMRAYVTKRYYSIDPVFRAAEVTRERFSWDDPDFLMGLGERQRRLLNEARRHGVASGITFALNNPGCVAASCSLIPKDGDVRMGALIGMMNLVWVAYGRALLLAQAFSQGEREARLSPRERDCLKLKATGFSVVEIGTRLGIAGATVRGHLNRAQSRLSARSRVHAVALALRRGYIS